MSTAPSTPTVISGVLMSTAPSTPTASGPIIEDDEILPVAIVVAFPSETLTIQSASGEETVVGFDPTATVYETKLKISEETGDFNETMTLTKLDGTLLENEMVLGQCGIKSNDVLLSKIMQRSFLVRQATLRRSRFDSNRKSIRGTTLGAKINACCSPVCETLALPMCMLLAFAVFLSIVYGSVYGCREWCYGIPETDVSFSLLCWFRTYFLLPCIIIGVPYQIFACMAEAQPFACPFVLFPMIPFFWIHTVLLYPAILLSDLNHYNIDYLPLADLAGSTAQGVWLTDHHHVRVGLELIVEANHACVKSESCGKNCVRCLSYDHTCMAPLLNATQYPLGDSAALRTLIDSNKKNLDKDGRPLFEVTAWATCDGIRSHCFQASKNTVGNVTRYEPSDELANSACYKSWFEPAQGLKRKGYNQPDPAVANSPWTTAAANAASSSTERYDVQLTHQQGHEASVKFYGLGIQTVAKALFVDYPTDPEADYLTFKGRVWEAVGVLTAFCFVFCLCLVACFVLADEGSGYTAATVMLGVLVVATIYRALRVPGLTPGDAGYHSIIG